MKNARVRKGRLAALAAFIVLGVPLVHAQEAAPTLQLTRSVDWSAGRITLEARRALDQATPSLVKAKAEAETDLEQHVPEALVQALGSLVVDSSHTLADYFSSDAALAARLHDTAAQAQRTDLYLSEDFSTLVARYAVPFFGDRGIAVPFFPSRATPIRRRLGDVTTRPYTGVLIFAQGPLPAAGTTHTATARAALFPRLWDEQMNLVLDRSMCAPDALARWGMVGYTQSTDDPQVFLRAGATPLRIAARGVFGDKNTDIVISMDAARQLLALQENIALLTQGKIVVVYDTVAEP